MSATTGHVSQDTLKKSWEEKKEENALTLKKTIWLIWTDARQKRIQMNRPHWWLSVFLGLFSINVIALAFWRLSMWLAQKHFPGAYWGAKLFQFMNIILFAFDASPTSSVGPGLVVAHLVGCTIHAKIGANCTLYGRNGLGGLGKRSIKGWLGGPVLEDGATVGFGASVLGGVVIGKNATIGAGAWCFEDVPENGIAIGMPAKLHRIKTNEEIARGASQ